MRERDLAWEALVKETAANPAVERGVLNAALKGIREAAYSEGLTEEGIPEEIRLRAIAYRQAFPGLTLTPMALAKHWFRVMVTPEQAAATVDVALIRRMAGDG
jgi:ABC-type arginine transport system permease subunit